MEPEDLFSVDHGIVEEAVGDFSSGLTDFEEELWQIVRRELQRVDTQGGKLVGTFDQIDFREIARSIPQQQMEQSINDMLPSFDELESNALTWHQEVNGIDPPKNLVNAIKDDFVDVTLRGLSQANINSAYTVPIQKALYTHINSGSSVVEVERIIRQLIIGQGNGGVITRWAGQVARDSLNQYQGQVHQAIKQRFDINGWQYVGNIVEDSRAQCRKWLNAFPEGKISDEQLKGEIRWAKSGGSYKGQKVGGLIKDVTVETFGVYRGGFNCLHKAYPVNVE